MEQQQTIKVMEKLINIAGLLKECKQYTKLYSVTHGDVLLDRIDNSEDALKQGVPDSQGFTQQTTLINESGLYSLIFGSKLESAKSFKRWVTSEVLPAIRKTGSYNLPSYQIENPIQRAEAWIQEEKERQALKEQAKQLAEENKNLENQIEEDAPKVIFAMAVTESKRSCLVAELAKIICQNGMEVGQNRLYQPMQRWVEAGMFEIKKRTITKPNGDLITVSTPLVTGKGQVYLVNKFLKRICLKMKIKNHPICRNIMLHFSSKTSYNILYCDKSIKSLLLINVRTL